MRNLERLTVETGQVIHRRYLLQRLVKRGNACAVYQGFDQVLQRTVAVKVVPAEHIVEYRVAIRATSQFSHPNIIGVYDVIIDPDKVCIVQEYVDGDDFSTLLQSQLAPYYVADMGMQMCQALLYASTSSRKVCHGDLTPASIIRDRRGQVRINNFVLPGDMYYFTAWSQVGSNGVTISDRELPLGQLSDGRRDDDTRAVGLLLYQLLSGRSPDATSVEPPPDGRLRFMRNVPPELCNVVAKAVVRQHPEHISTPDVLYAQLKTIAEALESVVPSAAVNPTPRYQGNDATRIAPYTAVPMQSSPLRTSFPRTTAEVRTPVREEMSAARVAAIDPGDAFTVADMPMKLASAQLPAYPPLPEEPPRRINVLLLLLIGLVLFAVFFAVGYFISNTLIP